MSPPPLLLWILVSFTPSSSAFPAAQAAQPGREQLPWPTYGSISDERMAQLGDFVPRERNLPEEDLPALDHDFFAFGVLLERTASVEAAGRPRSTELGGSPRLTEYSSEVRLMKRRKSSPPELTATDESTRDSVSMASRRLLRRPWMVSPGGRTERRCQGRASPVRVRPQGIGAHLGPAGGSPAARGWRPPPRRRRGRPSAAP